MAETRKGNAEALNSVFASLCVSGHELPVANLTEWYSRIFKIITNSVA
jgi:hypothetical protein